MPKPKKHWDVGIQTQAFNGLLDRFVEVANHYSSQLQVVENEPADQAIQKLIESLEKMKFNRTYYEVSVVAPTKTGGQNIVPTQDTLDALSTYRDDILRRLDNPGFEKPRRIEAIKAWLREPVEKYVTVFPSFTLAWDRTVEMSRLSVIPDSRLIQARDTVFMSAAEFIRFLDELHSIDTTGDAQTDKVPFSYYASMVGNFDRSKIDHLSEIVDDADLKIDVARIIETLPKLSEIFDDTSQSIAEVIIDKARYFIDLLANTAVKIGFTRWLIISDTTTHRKFVIKSLLYHSRILLEEGAWSRAVALCDFAISFTREANRRSDLPEDEGTAMIMCNRYWAQRKLAISIDEYVAAWDVSILHPRYGFLKLVLLRQFENSLVQLTSLIATEKSGNGQNISIEEVLEWPILEELRRSPEFEKWIKDHTDGNQ